jgi:hypothetical protein
MKDNNGKIRTFRIQDHLSRLAYSAPALALPVSGIKLKNTEIDEI